MPRYRFAWSNLPSPVLKSLARDLAIAGDPAEGLSRAFGVRPKPDFIQRAWPTLLDTWLSRDREVRRAVIETLRGYGLGRGEIPLRTKEGQMDYLRSCRNAPTLRDTVLTHFLAFGETEQIAPRTAAPVTPASVSRPAAEDDDASTRTSDGASRSADRAPDLVDGPERFNAWVAETLRDAMGIEALFVDDDGDIPIPRGSAIVYVRPLADGAPFLNLFSPLLSGFVPTAAVYEAVNAVNLQIPLARTMVVGDGAQIIMTADLLADGLTRAALLFALDMITDMADHFDTLLQHRLGGETMLDDEVASVDV